MEALLKQILNEMQVIKQTMATKDELTEIKQTMATKDELAEIKQTVLRMENTMSDKFGGLYDAREVQFDVNERICDSLNRIESKLDRMSLKVSSHDAILQRVK